MTLRRMLFFMAIYWLNTFAYGQNELADELPPELYFLLEEEKWDLHGRPPGEQEDLVRKTGAHRQHSPKVWSDIPHHKRNSMSKESGEIHSRSLLANLYRDHIISTSPSNFPERHPMHMNPSLDLDLEQPKRESANNYMRHHSTKNSHVTRSTISSKYTIKNPYHQVSKRVYNRPLSVLNLRESSADPMSVRTVRKVGYDKPHGGRPVNHKMSLTASFHSTSNQFGNSHQPELLRGPPHLHIRPLFASSHQGKNIKSESASFQSTSNQFGKTHQPELLRGPPHLHIRPLIASSHQGKNIKSESAYTVRIDKHKKLFTNIAQLL